MSAFNIVFLGDSTGVTSQIGYFNGVNSNLGLDSGIVLSTGDVMAAPGPNNGDVSTNAPGTNTDIDLQTITGFVSNSQDRAVLEFDFIPIGDSVEFKYVFASDEYPEFVNGGFNDVFGFFISGPGINGPYTNNAENIALIPGTATPVSIDNINNGNRDCQLGGPIGPCTNCVYYVNNCGGATVEYDGFTVVLTAKAIVQCGQIYHIKLAIQDVGDGAYDSGVFLQAKSFTSPGIQIALNTVLGDNNMNEGCADAYINFVRVDTDSVHIVHYEITGTATNGVDYVQIPDSVIFPVGEDSAQITVSLLNDLVPEGVENIIITVYNVIPCTGDTVVESATLIINEGYDLTMSSVGDTVTCALDPATISAAGSDGSPPYSYSWDNGMTGSPITVSVSVTDSFIVTASDLIGCKGVDTVPVTVLFPLPNTNAGSDSAICMGESVPLGGSPAGPAGATYSWTPSATLDNNALANPTATPIISTSYVLTVTDTNTCKNKDTVAVTVYNLPTVSAGSDTTICTGSPVQIGGSPTGPSGATYNWAPSGTLNNAALPNPVATPGGVTDYVVAVTDTNGCAKSDTAKVSLYAMPVAVASNDTAICIGDSALLIASGGVAYSWSPSTGLNSTTNDTVLAKPISTANYLVTVTDNNNCTDTESVLVIVNLVGVADAGVNTSICFGDTLQIGGSPTGAAGSVFTWSPNITISDTTLANPEVIPASAVTYFVTVTDINSCQSSDSIVVTVNNLPVAKAGNDTSICIGNSAQIGGSPTGPPGSVYTWNPSGSLNNATLSNPVATPVISTSYIVSVTDANSCVNSDTAEVTLFSAVTASASNDTSICKKDTIPLFASGGVSYNWNPLASLTAANISNPDAFPSTTTTFTVTVTDANSCTDTETVVITVLNLPIVDAGNDTALCVGDTVQTGGSPTSPTGVSFAWSPNSFIDDSTLTNPEVFPNATQTYIVQVTDGNSCVNTDSILVTVNNLPVVDAGNDTTICDGFSVVIGGGPTGPLNSTYLWSPAAALSSATASNPTATPTGNITYTVEVTDSNGCKNSDNMSFIVNANPVADAGAGGTLCVGDSLQLAASGGGLYNWFPTDSLTNPAIANPIAFPADTITYYLEVTDGNNCKDTDFVTVNVNQLPLADAGPDLWICPNDSIALNASGGVIYSWLPTSGLSDANISNPKTSPADTTEYLVTVTDANGCVNIDSMILTVGAIVPTEAGPDKEICIYDTTQIGGNPTAPFGSTYSWNTSIGLSDTAIANPQAFPQDTIMYYVTSTNFTCTGLDSVMVIVNPLPPIAAAATSAAICIGDTTQLSATGGISYVWTPTDSLSDDSIANPLAFPTDTTEYFVTGTDSKGCVNIDSIEIIVNPLPGTSAIAAVPEICTGDSVQINATGGADYVWTPADSLTDDSISNPVAYPSDTTNYVVKITDNNGCINYDSVVVIVNPLPVISLTASGTSICIGDTAQLSATGPPLSTYAWSPSDSISSTMVSNPLVFPSDTTTYTLTVTDSNFCIKKDSVTIVVNPLPLIVASASVVAICIGDTTQLNATGAVNFVWTPADSLNDDSIVNPLAYPSDTTIFYVTGTDGNGCVNIDSIEIIVNPLPLTTATAAAPEICIGDSVQLNASGGVNYAWTPAGSLTDNSISNPIAFPADTINYIVEVTDGNGCIKTDSVTVVVNPLPVITITSATNPICFNDTTQLNATGGDTYAWSPSDSLNNPAIADPIAFPADTTTYLVIVTDSNGCVNADSITILVNPLPGVDAGLNDSICIGDTAQLFASGASAFAWSPNDSLSDDNIANPLAYPSATITYTVVGTNNNGCSNTDSVEIFVNPLPVITMSGDTEICFGDSVQLFASGGNFFSWSPADSLSNPFQSNPDAFPSDTTTYVVTVTDFNNCVNKDSVTVEVNPLPSNMLGNDPEICVGDSVQLNASGGNVYSWNPVDSLSNPTIADPIAYPVDTTEYIVTVTDSNGCVNSDSITVLVNFLPLVDAGANDTICSGDTTQLNASGAINYVWIPDVGLSDDSISNPFAFPADTTEFFVSGTDAKGCSNNDSVMIIVQPLPVVAASVAPAEICFGDTAQLSASGGIEYTWLPSDSLTDDSISNPFAFPADTTLYIVTVKDTNNCINQDSVTVVVNPLPSNILGNDIELCIGDSVQLLASGGDNYSWFPSDSLSNPAINNPMAFPADTIMYIVTVVDSNGCTNADSITVEVNLLPLVDAGLSDTICYGDSAQLLATGAANYLWSPAVSVSNPAIENPYAFPTDTSFIIVTGTDSNSCSNTDSVLIVVNPLPVTSVNAGADTVTACNGDSVQLTATGGISYQWNPSAGLNNANIANPIATIAETQEYFVSVTDTNGCATIDSITIGIFNSPLIDAGMDTSICGAVAIGGGLAFLNANGGSTYSWTPIASLSNPYTANPTASPTSTTTYYVTGIDSLGCSGVDSVTVYLIPSLDWGVISNDTSICQRSCVELMAQGAAVYAWVPPTGLSSFKDSIVTACPDSTTTYIVKACDVARLNYNGDFELGDTAFFSNYQYYDTASSNPITSGEYSIVNDASQADTNWVGNADSTGGNFYVASFSIGDSNAFCQTIQVQPNTSYQISFWLTSLLVTMYPSSTQLWVNGFPYGPYVMTPDTPGVWEQHILFWYSGSETDMTVCINGVWGFESSNVFGLDDFYVRETRSCSYWDTVTVVVNPLPFANAGTDKTTCKNQPVVIGGLPTGPDSCLFSWIPATYLDNPGIGNPLATVNSQTDFILTVTDTNSLCNNTDTTLINVFYVNASPDTTLCADNAVQIFVYPQSGSGGYQYDWEPSSGLSDTAISNPVVLPGSDATYLAIVTDTILGCTDSAVVDISVLPAPSADFTFTLEASCVGAIAEFENKSVEAESYLWIFGDNNTSTKENPEHLFLYNQMMDVTLVAINSSGCDDSSSVTRNIKSFDDYFNITVPNVFTPDGDGKNDWFEIRFDNKLQECTDVKIFNRWGEMIFSSSGNQHSWSGRTFAGEAAPNGTYFYVFDINGKEFKGTVTLIR